MPFSDCEALLCSASSYAMKQAQGTFTKTVPKFKTSNYWFEKAASLSRYFFFCCSSYFISRFEMLPSSENPVRLILNHSRHTFSSSEFRLHCGNKRWKSLSSYELCRWDQIKRSGKNHAARIKKKHTHIEREKLRRWRKKNETKPYAWFCQIDWGQ